MRSRTRQQHNKVLSCARATKSHCSKPHSDGCHQSPLDQPGTIGVLDNVMLLSKDRMSLGRCPCTVTGTASAGRSFRIADRDCLAGIADDGPDGTVNGSMLNPPGWYVSLRTGRPTFSSPTMPRIRASVTSSRDGSGNCGENNPNCTLLVLPGSASKVRARIAACGGCASRSR